MRIERAVPIVVVAIFLMGCSKADRSVREEVAKGQVRITQFYATKPTLPKDEEGLLCYGVENATAVRLNPEVEKLWPSLSRCIAIAPRQTTTYTLMAEDSSGKSVSQSVTVNAGAALPKFTDVSISAMQVKPGETVAFCFKASGVVSVKGKPGYFQKGGNVGGDCLVNQPTKTTAYQITLVGAGGQTEERNITVVVR